MPPAAVSPAALGSQPESIIWPRSEATVRAGRRRSGLAAVAVLAALLFGPGLQAAVSEEAADAAAIRAGLLEVEALSTRDLAAAAERARRLEASAQRLGEDALAFEAGLLLIDALLKGRRLDEAAPLLDAIADSPGLGDRPAAASRVLVLRARWLRDRNRIPEAESAFAEATRLAEASGDEGLLAIVLNSHGAMLWRQADTERAATTLERALAINRRLDRPGEAIKNLSYLSLIARDRGDLDLSLRLNDEVLAIAEARGDLRGIGVAANSAGLLLVQQGDSGRAAELFARAAEAYRQVGDPTGEGPALGNLGDILIRLGRVDEAAPHLDRALQLALDSADVTAETAARANRAGWALKRGDLDMAEREALASLAAARQQPAPSPGATAFGVLADVRMQQGRLAEAIELGASAVDHARRQGRLWVLRDRLSAHAARLRADQRGSEAYDALREAYELNDRIRAEDLRRELARAEADFLARERDAELSARAARIDLLEAQAQQQRSIRWLLLGLLLVSALLVVVLVNRMLLRQRSERQLREQNAVIERVNRELAEAADTDVLTGARNRRYFHRHLLPWLRQRAAAGEGFALALVDADHFKAINDRFGHDVGDAALVALANAWMKALSPGDTLVRWGGEEFLVVTAATGENASALVERGRSAVALARLPPECGDLRLSVSVGWVEGPWPGRPIEALLAAADRALLIAKQEGRDRAVRLGPE